jgi:hypothetical protein
MGRQSEEGVVADQRTGFPGSWVILAHMNPIGADGAGEIGTVVEMKGTS